MGQKWAKKGPKRVYLVYIKDILIFGNVVMLPK